MSDERIASEVISASLGGAISASVLYPLEVLKTKLQAETKPPPLPLSSTNETTSSSSSSSSTSKQQQPLQWTMWQYAKHVANTEGYQVFIDGFETSAFQSAMEKALYFFAYTILKQLWRRMTNNKPLNTLTNLLLGCCAEWCHLPITLPLDCWTTYIQTQSKQNVNEHASTKHGPLAMFLALLSEKGWAGLYKGWQAYYVLCFKPALQYTVFEQVKAMVLQHRRILYQKQQQQQRVHTSSPSASSPLTNTSLGAMESFLLGMVARVVATMLTFPYVRAKVVLQTRKKGDTSTTSISEMLWDMYQQRGLSSWFQGIGPELTRGVLSAALMLMIKEQLYTIVDHALYGTATPTITLPTQQNREQPQQLTVKSNATTGASANSQYSYQAKA